MKTTKSGKPILNGGEHTIEEEEEAIKATKYARKQRHQYYKRLWYLPLIGSYVVLIAFLGAVMCFVYLVGFTAGESSKVCTVKNCQTKTCFFVQGTCELPKSGATIHQTEG